MRTALYRFYDTDDALLYVGITDNPHQRWIAHRSQKSWWRDVSRKTVEWFDTREDALLEEKRVMRDERPLHNVSSSPWRAVEQKDGSHKLVPKPPSTPVRYLRICDPVWDGLKVGAEDFDLDRSKVINDLIDWFLRRPGASLPDRPSRARIHEIARLCKAEGA